MSWIWVVAMVLGLAGSPEGTADPAVVPSELVAQWSQATYDVETPAAVPSSVIDSEGEREAFLDRLPADLQTDEVEAVDLAEHVLVVGGYHSCQQSSFVENTGTGYVLGVTRTPEGLACGWSPYTIDVRAVAR